jgi:NADPH-dependent stearoyl-CoA 9-desaturase
VPSSTTPISKTPISTALHRVGSPSTTAAAFAMTDDELDELGRALDAIRSRVTGDLGQADVDYLRRFIRVQRGLEVAGRGLFFLGWVPPVWALATAMLGVSKILDNMEIGHNVMHGQYDWTNDPALSSSTFDWDTACPADQWKHSHNFVHHTFTNIVDKDRDIGYGVLRISPSIRWSPAHLANPVVATLLALNFDLGVMLHDVEFERVVKGERSKADAWETLRGGLKKTGRLAAKDYVIWPLVTGPMFLSTLAGNAVANLMRNVWAFTIIFCGHFPDGTYEFTVEECDGESRGHWYFRQLLGSANLEGGALFHVMSGNLSHQIEHHLFPDLPARRYKEVAPEVRALCERFGLPYNTGGLARQFGTVVRKILRFSLPERHRGSATPTPPGVTESPLDLVAA